MEPAYLIEEEVKKPGVLPDVGISLNPDSFVPYYEQIVGQIRNAIQIGRLHAGASFYSEGEIARSLGISKMPVRHAFQKLRDEGFADYPAGQAARDWQGAGSVGLSTPTGFQRRDAAQGSHPFRPRFVAETSPPTPSRW